MNFGKETRAGPLKAGMYYYKNCITYTLIFGTHWNLANEPWDYYYSSARYYELNEKNFDFSTDVREEF